MISVGDKVFQTKYDWGKYPNGLFKTYIVKEITNDNHALGGGRGISCIEVDTSQFIHYIPENTWIKIENFRDSKIEQILS
jgi:hypothetical protein